LSTAQLEACWNDLTANDAGKAWQAIGTLTASPKQSVSFLHEHLQRAVPREEPKRLEQLLAALDDEEFRVREQATADLLKLGKPAVPILRKAMEKGLSGEARKRVETILERLRSNSAMPADILRSLRGIETLERVGTALARKALEDLTRVLPSALAEEARQAAERLSSKPSP
jgi:hypothetical protein